MEQQAIEKVEAIYTKEIERLEKQVTEARHERERDREMLRDDYQEKLKGTLQVYNERKEELLAQNDGMLGVVGRLHSENQTLKQDLLQAQMRVKKAEESLEEIHNRVEAEMEGARQQMDERVERIKEDAARDIRDLKKQVEEFKAKGKKTA